MKKNFLLGIGKGKAKNMFLGILYWLCLIVQISIILLRSLQIFRKRSIFHYDRKSLLKIYSHIFILILVDLRENGKKAFI